MAATKTDNSFMADKVGLRINHLPTKENFRVLDVFGGHGLLWRAVEKKTGRTFRRESIDNRNDLKYIHCHGDNTRVMRGMDLGVYDVIDLDAYGVPFDQMEAVFDQDFKGIVFVTMIQTMFGSIPKSMAAKIGLPPLLYNEIPALVSRRGWGYFRRILKIPASMKFMPDQETGNIIWPLRLVVLWNPEPVFIAIWEIFLQVVLDIVCNSEAIKDVDHSQGIVAPIGCFGHGEVIDPANFIEIDIVMRLFYDCNAGIGV